MDIMWEVAIVVGGVIAMVGIIGTLRFWVGRIIEKRKTPKPNVGTEILGNFYEGTIAVVDSSKQLDDWVSCKLWCAKPLRDPKIPNEDPTFLNRSGTKVFCSDECRMAGFPLHKL